MDSSYLKAWKEMQTGAHALGLRHWTMPVSSIDAWLAWVPLVFVAYLFYCLCCSHCENPEHIRLSKPSGLKMPQ